MEEAKRNRLVLIVGTAIALVIAGFGYAALSSGTATANPVTFAEYETQYNLELKAFDELSAAISDSSETLTSCADSVKDDGVCQDLEEEIDIARAMTPTDKAAEGSLEDYNSVRRESVDNQKMIEDTCFKLTGLNETVAEAKQRFLERLTVSQISMSEALTRAELAIDESDGLLTEADGLADSDLLTKLRDTNSQLKDAFEKLSQTTKTDPDAYDKYGQDLLDLIGEIEDDMKNVRESRTEQLAEDREDDFTESQSPEAVEPSARPTPSPVETRPEVAPSIEEPHAPQRPTSSPPPAPSPTPTPNNHPSDPSPSPVEPEPDEPTETSDPLPAPGPSDEETTDMPQD